MPTYVDKVIGSAPSDYTDLQTWEADGTYNLVSADQIWRGFVRDPANGGNLSGSSTLLTISGQTVDSTHYVELTTSEGASFRDQAGVQTTPLKYDETKGASIRCSGTGGGLSTIVVNADFTRISNLQVAQSATDAAASIGIQNTNGGATSTFDVNNCIVEVSNTAVCVSMWGSNQRIRNTLCVTRKNANAGIVALKEGAKAVNCTFVVPSDLTAATNVNAGASYGAPDFKNCAAFGATFFSSGTTPTTTTCKSDAASLPSGTTIATYANQFENTVDATRDFRLKSGADCIDNGTTDTTYAAVDIAKTNRPSGANYDIGAWEFVSGAPAAPALLGQACL